MSVVDISTSPDGLFFFENAVQDSFGSFVEEWFQTTKVQSTLSSVTNSQGKSSDNSRKVIHYGYKYDYKSGGTKQEASEFPHIINILLGTISKVWKDAPMYIGRRLNQCIINKYRHIQFHLENI